MVKGKPRIFPKYLQFWSFGFLAVFWERGTWGGKGGGAGKKKLNREREKKRDKRNNASIVLGGNEQFYLRVHEGEKKKEHWWEGVPGGGDLRTGVRRGKIWGGSYRR